MGVSLATPLLSVWGWGIWIPVHIKEQELEQNAVPAGFKVVGRVSSLFITFQSLQSGGCSPFQVIFIMVAQHCPAFLDTCCKHHM